MGQEVWKWIKKVKCVEAGNAHKQHTGGCEATNYEDSRSQRGLSE